MKILQINHVALHVQDVAVSERFYRMQIGLDAIPRPDFDFPGAWFRIGVDQELHLIGDRTAAVQSHHRGTHFAVLVDDIQRWDEHLAAAGAERLPVKTRPDGARQIFVIDPDGHWIEFCQYAAET